MNILNYLKQLKLVNRRQNSCVIYFRDLNMAQKSFLKCLVVCTFFITIYLYFIAIPSFYYISKIATLKQEYVRSDLNNTENYVNKNQRSELSVDHKTQRYNTSIDIFKEDKLKYILLWTFPDNIPFVHMGLGRSGFLSRNCKYTNCFVTGDKYFFGDNYSNFDVVAFAATELNLMPKHPLPTKRSLHQKFVFASIESAANYPICTEKYDGFFNWTWTYRLDSDARWGYIVVRDKNGTVIGPRKEMHWIKLEDMDPVNDDLKKNLSTKSVAAAWFLSNCESASVRERYGEMLINELIMYGLTVDVYGSCGDLKCPRFSPLCYDKLEKDYYFYLSFENSFCEDYVTEKLLHPLKHNSVPIVYGGANYTRFMPDGIYVDANLLTAKELAKKIYFLIQNPEEYYQYFRWKNHYSFHQMIESVETNEYCHFCEMLNNKDLVEKVTVYESFSEWWSPASVCEASLNAYVTI